MDFNALLDSATSNAKKHSKVLNGLESEVALERKEKLKRLEIEKRRKEDDARRKRKEAEQAKRQKEEEDKKKFTIPKKNNEGAVDKDQIAAFKARKEQEEREALKKKMAEKERLIQLRLQNFGGKANKKLGKHFGLDPMAIQIRYGNDHEHVERLQKQQWREEEELDAMASSYRDGVYKAIQAKRKTEEKLRTSGDTPKQPHRVATSKSNSLAGLSSRHAASRDHFSPPRETKAKTPKQSNKPPERKRPAAPPVDFSKLMQAAENISQGKNVKLADLTAPSPASKPTVNDRRSEPSSSRSSAHGATSSKSYHHEKSRAEKDREPSKVSARPLSQSSQPVRPIKPAVAPSKPTSQSRQDNKKDSSNEDAAKKSDRGGRFVKKPTPPPIIPAAVPGKKYLPGDVRYQASMGSSASVTRPVSASRPSGAVSNRPTGRSGISKGGSTVDRMKDRPSSSKDSRPSSSKDRPSSSKELDRNERFREAQRLERQRGPDRERGQLDRDRERDRERDRRRLMQKEKERERIRRNNEKRRSEEQMSLVERDRMREMKRKYGNYSPDCSEDEEEDDDYDSDMDGFIDDTGLDEDDLYQQELEDTLKMVNPKYNKQLWKKREREIDERNMHARYGDIQREEKRSARIGFLEDLKEAQAGKSVALG